MLKENVNTFSKRRRPGRRILFQALGRFFFSRSFSLVPNYQEQAMAVAAVDR